MSEFGNALNGTDDVSVVRLARLLARRPQLIARSAIAVSLLTAVAVAFSPRTWESHASFVPVGGGRTGSLSGLAAQFGLQVPVAGGDGAAGSNFYADLATSDEILRAVSSQKYEVRQLQPDSVVSLEAWYKIEDSDPRVRQEYVIRQLKAAISTSVSLKTGLVELKVKASNPYIAEGLVRAVVSAIDSFDIHRRSAAAADEKRFQEVRLNAATNELTSAELRVRDFLQRNGSFRTPTLALEYDRLTREVAAKHALVSTLQVAMEQSRLEEARDTRRIALIDAPQAPVLPVRRRLLLKTIAGAFAGAALAILWIIVSDAVRRQLIAADSLRESHSAG